MFSNSKYKAIVFMIFTQYVYKYHSRSFVIRGNFVYMYHVICVMSGGVAFTKELHAHYHVFLIKSTVIRMTICFYVLEFINVAFQYDGVNLH